MAKTIKDVSISVSPGIESLVPYPPGKPIEELERELGITGSIKLASNENPLGPSKKALEAARKAVENVHRYPDGSCYYLKRRLADFTGLSEKELIVGNGSNEIIELMIRTFLSSGDEVIMGDPSFAVYPLVTQAAGGKSIKAPLKGFTIDMDAIAAAITPKTRLIFIANPNNPTGTIVGKEAMDRFMDKVPDRAIVCMDEAYFEYVRSKDFPDSIGYLKEGRTVVVLRTFSKIYGLAGLRVGYGAAPAKIVDYLDRVRQPFNVNLVAQAAATAALDDTAHVEASRRTNGAGLEYLYAELKKMKLEYVPTEANFFLIKVGDGAGVYTSLLKKGVIVRPMKSYGLGEFIRVTVGTEAENKRFVEALKGALGA